MCHGRIDIAALEKRHRVDFAAYFADALERLQTLVADRLVSITPDAIVATPHGRMLLRTIAMCFDRYLQEPGIVGTVPRFSRVV